MTRPVNAIARIGTLFVLALSLSATRADAGTGASTACSDGTAGQSATEVDILDDPVTLGAEIGTSPAAILLCYSTTSVGDGVTAFTGGTVRIDLTNEDVACTSDSPTVIAVDCDLRDDDPTRGGRTLDVTARFQGTVVELEAGIEFGTLGPLVCLHRVTVYSPAGTFGPHRIGVCAS